MTTSEPSLAREIEGRRGRAASAASMRRVGR
jgi:hypothetical protein